MLIKPLLVEQDETALMRVGQHLTLLSHRFDMTAVFEDPAVVQFLTNHPRVDRIPHSIDAREQGYSDANGPVLFQAVEDGTTSVTLRNISEHHTVVEEILTQFADELEDKTSWRTDSNVDLILLPALTCSAFHAHFDIAINVYGSLEVMLSDEELVSLPCDRLLSSYPKSIVSIKGIDDVNLVLVSKLSVC